MTADRLRSERELRVRCCRVHPVMATRTRAGFQCLQRDRQRRVVGGEQRLTFRNDTALEDRMRNPPSPRSLHLDA